MESELDAVIAANNADANRVENNLGKAHEHLKLALVELENAEKNLWAINGLVDDAEAYHHVTCALVQIRETAIPAIKELRGIV